MATALRLAGSRWETTQLRAYTRLRLRLTSAHTGARARARARAGLRTHARSRASVRVRAWVPMRVHARAHVRVRVARARRPGAPELTFAPGPEVMSSIIGKYIKGKGLVPGNLSGNRTINNAAGSAAAGPLPRLIPGLRPASLS